MRFAICFVHDKHRLKLHKEMMDLNYGIQADESTMANQMEWISNKMGTHQT